MAKPRLWRPFEKVTWAREYEHAHDGRIRDRSRNVLPVRGPHNAATFSVRGSGKYTRSVADVLALEWHGHPGFTRCPVCQHRIWDVVVHLDGDRRNFARDNLKHVPDEYTMILHRITCVKPLVSQWPEGTPWGAGDYQPGCLSPAVSLTK